MDRYIMVVINTFLCLVKLAESRQYYIKEGEVPSFLYHKFENVQEDIFPSFITIKVAFSVVTGTLLYSIDRNMNQLIVTMRDDIHMDTRFGVQVEFNTQLIIVSLSQLCGREGTNFDERNTLTLQIFVNSHITLMCDGGKSEQFLNEKRNRIHDNYPIMYNASESDRLLSNEAHMWLVNHPMIGGVYPNHYQMHGCIFNVNYIHQSIHFANVTTNVGERCTLRCTDNMCNGGQCFVIYSEITICNCTKAFLNGPLCKDSIHPMNFLTDSQRFVFKMFKLSWKSESLEMMKMSNRNIQINLGRKDSNLFFEYNFSNYSRWFSQVTLSHKYVPNSESICIVYFHTNMINIWTYNNHVWNSTWIPSIFDIRQEVIDNMTFRSGDGIMDFVFKISPEYLWTSIEFTKIITFKSDKKNDYPRKVILDKKNDYPRKVILASIIPILTVLVLGGSIWLIYRKWGRRRRGGDSEKHEKNDATAT